MLENEKAIFSDMKRN